MILKNKINSDLNNNINQPTLEVDSPPAKGKIFG